MAGVNLFAEPVEPAEQSGRNLFAEPELPVITSPQQPFEGTGAPDTGIMSAIKTIATAAPSMLASGLGGAVETVVNQDPTTAAQNMARFQEDFTIPPTEQGAKNLQSLGAVFEKAGKYMRLGIDTYDALLTAAQTGDPLQGVSRFEQNRIDPQRGERSLPLGPGAATMAEIGPEAAIEAGGSVIGITTAKTAIRAAENIQRMINRPDIDVFDQSGRFTDQAISELEKLQPQQAVEAVQEAQSAGMVLTPDQARRLNVFRERGVTPLRADITRSTEDSIDQQQAIKESEKIARVAAGQDERLSQLVREGITETGGIANDAEEASASIRAAVIDVATDLDNKVTEAYRLARESAAGGMADISDYIEFVRANKGKDKITGGVVSSAMTDLRNRGLLKKDADTMISIEQAEEIRQALNKDFESATPRGRNMIREMKEAIDLDVESAAGADIFTDARAANIRFKEALKRARRDKFDKSKGSLIEDILENRVPEEKIFQKIISPSTRADDIEKLRDFMLRYDNKQAWDDLRAQVLRNALDKATSTQGVREGGVAVFNARLFGNEMKRIRGKKFDLLFNDDEKKLINDIREIGISRVPISGTFSGEGPSSIAVRRASAEVRDSILGRIPAIGPLAEGMVDAMRQRKRDRRLLEFTEPTEKAIKRGQ